MCHVQPSSPIDWVLQEALGKRANEDIERALEGCTDARQMTLLSILHCWGRNSPSGVFSHLQAWLQLAKAGAAREMEKLAAQLMAGNRLLGPGLLDLWLEETRELASQQSEQERAAAVSDCSLLEDARRKPASLSHTHSLLEVLQACRDRAADDALQRAQEAQLQGARTPVPSANLEVSGAGLHTASPWTPCLGHNSVQLM